MYTQCPKKWALQYRDGHKVREQSIHMTFGTALHETLQMYLDVMYNKSAAEADRIDLVDDFEERLRNCYAEAYKTNSKEHFSTPDQLREFFDDGIVDACNELYWSKPLHDSRICVAPNYALYDFVYVPLRAA